jgi:hypothetical protein
MARRLTRAEALDSWRVDAELSGYHTVLGFIAAPRISKTTRAPCRQVSCRRIASCAG